MTMRRRTFVAAATGLVTGARAKSTPLLIVGGTLGRTNDAAAKSYSFGEEEFLALPQSTIETATSWTPRSRWVGPKISAVMSSVKATPGNRLRVAAVDDYHVTIPWSDMERWGIILAHSRDGVRLERKQWGPLFVIYPRDNYPRELNTPMTEAKFIWQVHRIDIE